MAATDRTDRELDAELELQQHIKQLDRFGFLFGQKLSASMSPLLHDVVYRNLGLKWEQIRLDSKDMARFLDLIQDSRFYGASVTMPHKVAIMKHLHELTPECSDVGACNTIFLRERADGSRIYCGTNTDVIGVRESFLQNVPDGARVWEGRPALVVGSGGAARSAVYALRKWLNVTDIYLVNRDDAEVAAVMEECQRRGYGSGMVHVRTAEQARALEGPGAVVACVPDFPPATDREKVAREVTRTLLDKPHKGAMLEMCYNPSPYTELGSLAGSLGWNVILGTEALIYQGIEQDKYWTGRPAHELPVKAIQETIADKLRQVSRL